MKKIKYVEPNEYMPKEIRDRFFPKTDEAKPAKEKKRTVKRNKTGK